MNVNVDITNSNIDLSRLSEELERIKDIEVPPFVESVPDVEKIISECKDIMHYKKVIVIGNGGSVNNTRAFYDAVPIGKEFYFATTMEPDFLNFLLKKCPREDTIVVPVSKSGTTTGVLETLMFFINNEYDICAITSPQGTLFDICQKKGYNVIEHPPVGGRYSARTSCAMAPAYLMGYNLNELEDGFQLAYENNSKERSIDENPALRLACALYLLEQEGKEDVFMPVYSMTYSAFLPIIIQLSHESFGKEGKGQSFFGDVAPESQHHTNQRFFGGRQNICGMFVSVKNQIDSSSEVSVPDDIKEIPLRSGNLDTISSVPYKKALEFEFKGTYEDAVAKGIPVCHVEIEDSSYRSIGEFMGFLQYFAVYSSILRGVNPYDQPQVEDSKALSFRMRQDYKR